MEMAVRSSGVSGRAATEVKVRVNRNGSRRWQQKAGRRVGVERAV